MFNCRDCEHTKYTREETAAQQRGGGCGRLVCATSFFCIYCYAASVCQRCNNAGRYIIDIHEVLGASNEKGEDICLALSLVGRALRVCAV